jgi:hypothetical protein
MMASVQVRLLLLPDMVVVVLTYCVVGGAVMNVSNIICSNSDGDDIGFVTGTGKLDGTDASGRTIMESRMTDDVVVVVVVFNSDDDDVVVDGGGTTIVTILSGVVVTVDDNDDDTPTA